VLFVLQYCRGGGGLGLGVGYRLSAEER